MSAIAEKIDVTVPGVTIVLSKKDSQKSQFLAPLSNSFVSVEKAKVPRRAPTRIQFGMLRNRGLRMIAPIPLELERKGDTVVARWDRIEEFGYGRNISEAVDDFGRTLEELYFTLKEKQEELSEDLRQVWDVVRLHIQESRR